MLAAGAVLPFGGLHWGEFLPPVGAACAYAALYLQRYRRLASEGRPPARWRAASFLTGVVIMVAVQVGPADSLGDQILAVHMLQHLVLGDFCSLLLVLGLTGPMLAPLLRIRVTRPLRVLAHPLIALVLWAVDLYGWHVPFFYELAIRVDLVHALEHACLLWFGTLLWLALIGPLPKPSWFTRWGEVAYVVAVRFLGAVVANAFLWAQVVFYPVYRTSDAARGLSPLSDQNIAGGAMLLVQVLLTALLLGWILYRVTLREGERQALLDFARSREVELSDVRAARAALAGSTEQLRARIARADGPDAPG